MTEPLDLDAIRGRYDRLDRAQESSYGIVGDRASAMVIEPAVDSACDVPALLAEVERLTGERDRLRAAVALMFPVVEVAVDWHEAPAEAMAWVEPRLRRAVDAYTAGQVEVPPTPTTDAEIEALPRLELADWERNLIDAQAGARQPRPRLVDLATVTGYVWTDPRSGQQHTLAPEDVTVVVRGDPTPPKPRVITWDWKEQLPLDDVRSALDAGLVHLHEVDTRSDQYAIVLASARMGPAGVAAAYEQRHEDEDGTDG